MGEKQHRNALPVDFEIQEYRIEKVLGAGGFGIAYLAEDQNLERKVVLKEHFPKDYCVRTGDGGTGPMKEEYKELAEKLGKSFMKEAKTLARLDHPNLVRVFRAFKHSNSAYLVMEYLEGQSLAHHVAQLGGVPSESQVVEWLGQILSGLSAVHSVDLVHRDLKPSNIMVTGGGALKLIDFGTARPVTSGKTRINTNFATPGYSPVEQYVSRRPQGAYTDFYALGATFYHILTGELPEESMNRYDGFEMVSLSEKLKGQFSPALLETLDHCLEIEGAKRPQSVDEVLQRLREPARGSSVVFKPEPEDGGQVADPVRFALPTVGEDWIVPELGLAMKWIAPGRCTMGSPKWEKGRSDNETQHEVNLTRGYWLGVYEVTQADWKAIMGTNPSHFKGSDRLPVETVSWEDCMEFCQNLNARERAAGRLSDNMEYALPTEAQWEYACRAGTSGMTWAGDFKIHGDRNAPDLGRIAWYGGNSIFQYENGHDSSGWAEKEINHGKSGSQVVGGKGSNPWGLYDMLGNVWEWCRDWYGDYPTNSVSDPKGPPMGSHRMVRGGGWFMLAWYCRSANRSSAAPSYRGSRIGFRLSLQSGE